MREIRKEEKSDKQQIAGGQPGIAGAESIPGGSDGVPFQGSECSNLRFEGILPRGPL